MCRETFTIYYIYIKNVKTDIQLQKDFFKKMDLNFGKVTAAGGYLEGNVVASFWAPRRYVIMTVNWIPADIKKAGFKTRDKLILNDGTEVYGNWRVDDTRCATR